jgi:hypothetical protein
MHQDGSKLIRSISLSVVCLLCFALTAAVLHFARSSSASSPGATHSSLAAAHFAIADLDGDLLPDLAVVEVESQRSVKTNYSIRLKLSAGTQPAISVNAPSGGLTLTARDVNGDDTLDLIVTSVLDARVIVVLLNDGHGRFSVAKSGAYAIATESDVFFCQREGSLGDRITLAQGRPAFDGDCAGASNEHPAPSTGSVPASESSLVVARALYASCGRSPPSRVFLA